MRTWRKTLGVMAGGLVGLGGLVSSADAQYPPPGAIPPGMGMPGGMPTGMGMPGGGGYAMPPMSAMPPNMAMPPSMGGPSAQPTNGGGFSPGAFGGAPMGAPADFPNASQPSGEPASPLSLKEEGMPNAFSELVDPRSLRPLHFQLSAGYSMLWYRAAHLPATATTGSANDPVPGAIGQPGTVILSQGNRDAGGTSAFQTSATFWLRDPELFCFQLSYFLTEQRSQTFAASTDGNGNPVLGRPYYNPVLNREDFDIRGFPGALKGSISDAITTQLMGGEANFRWFSGNNPEGASVNFLFGARWLQLRERYSSYDVSGDLANAVTATTFSDNFAAQNQFIGGQIGAEWQYRMDRFTFSLLGKVAVGPNFQSLTISGETVRTDLVTGLASKDAQGLYAQPSNVGSYGQTRLAVLPEVTAKWSFDVTPHLRFNLGYTYFAQTEMLRAGDQIDRTVNIQPLQTNVRFPPLLPGAPQMRQSTFSVNMVNVGLELLF